jgi:hypothetical protein
MSSPIGVGESLETGSLGDVNIVVCSGMSELTLLLLASSRSTPVAPAMMPKPTNILTLARTQPTTPGKSAVCVGGAVSLQGESVSTLSEDSVGKAPEAETFFLPCANLNRTFITKDVPEHQST